MSYNMDDENVCNDCGLKLVECDMCSCCGGCCDCDLVEDNVSSPHREFWEDEFIDLPECKMCGKESRTNNEGYCSQCWTIWNS